MAAPIQKTPSTARSAPCLNWRFRRGPSGTVALPDFLVDSDVFIDHLRAGKRVPVPPRDSAYSVLTRAELYAGRNADENVVDLLLSAFEELPIDRAIAEEAGRIRRGVGISLADAVIAATALLSRRVLVTRNVKDFRKVSGLRLRTGR